MTTLFEKIYAGEIPASVVFKDDRVIAFLDIHPYNPGHTLVVPKYAAASLQDLPSDYAARMFEVGHLVLKALYKSEIPCHGVNLKLNDGSAAGQDVMHCHLHVIPRLEGDRLSSGYWRPGELWGNDRRAELDKIAASIKACL